MNEQHATRILATLALLPESIVLALHPLGLVEPWTPHAAFFAALACHGLLLFGTGRRRA